MEELKKLTDSVLASWCEILQRGFGGVHKAHKRCGKFLYYIDGMKSELGCTRRKGHAGNHRLRMRVIGRRGRKYYNWPEPRLMVAFALAE